MITSATDMHILRDRIREKALNNLKQASVTLAKKIFRIFSMNLGNNIDKWLKGFVFIFSWSEDESQTLMVDPNGEVYLIGVIYSGRGMVSHLPASAWGSSTPANIETTQFLPIHTHHHDPVSGGHLKGRYWTPHQIQVQHLLLENRKRRRLDVSHKTPRGITLPSHRSWRSHLLERWRSELLHLTRGTPPRSLCVL